MSFLRAIISRRDLIILAAFALLAVVIFYRLFSLTIVEAQEFSEQGSQQRTAEYLLPARRGTLYDRNGNILATSVEAVTICANPSKIKNPELTAKLLQKILGNTNGGTYEQYYEKLTANPEASFVFIAKKVDPDFEQAIRLAEQDYVNEEIKALRERGDDIPAELPTPFAGFEFRQTTRREYPKGSIGAQVIGSVQEYTELVELDGVMHEVTYDIGVSGLEASYDELLRGVNGYRIVEESKPANLMSSPLPMIGSVIKELQPQAGQDLILTIDIEMQQYLELNLQAVSRQRKTENSWSILLDGATGDIVATASLPLFDRSNATEKDLAQGATNAKAITLPYEPGSTFKSVIASAALEQGLLTADSVIFCPAYYEIYDKVVHDSTTRDDMEMSLRRIISHSSNVGVTLVEELVGDAQFNEYLTRYGLGSFTHVDYPGETAGNVPELEDWTPIMASNMSFGQNLEVSSLQIASIYGAFANDGVMVQPHFLLARPQTDTELSWDSRRVLSVQASRELEELLRSCVTEGYGSKAAIEGLDVVGKTGTAEKAGVDGYEGNKGEYITSFVGYLDNSTSKLVFMSAFDNPVNSLDSPATTFFSVVMSFVANRYLITPAEEPPYGEAVQQAQTQEQTASGGAEAQQAQGAQARSLATGPQQPTNAVESSVIKPPTPRVGRDWQLDTSG